MGQHARRIAGATAWVVAALLASASAHLEPGSLSSPQTGQSYPAGSPVKITWVQTEYHSGKYTLAWSRDGGATWDSIATWNGPSGDGVTVNYAWTVPDAPGPARVRVCQLGECTDPDYRLASGVFTIAPASAVKPAVPAERTGLAFHPDSRTLDVTMVLDRAGDAVLEAFDARGVRTAVLLESRLAAGRHVRRLDSPLLRAGRPMVLRLSLDGRIAGEIALP